MNSDKISVLREAINGELDRISRTKDLRELDNMWEFVQKNLDKYYDMNKDRIFDRTEQEEN